jgi:23S rRNA (uracil1939-C5)-methyltransferase
MNDLPEVKIEKLVHGGQGLGDLPDGRKVFVWNALPGEKVAVRIIKQKRSYCEAVAEEIIVASSERIQADEPNYLATSPWQIMSFEAENQYKSDIVRELFRHEKLTLPDFGETEHAGEQWHYRNKMEYSFWGDDDGLHLALHQRGSHGKQIVTGSKLAMPSVDQAANAIRAQLNDMPVRAGDLKTIIVRSTQAGKTAASLFVKPQSFDRLELPAGLQGLRIYHSNPKSPASVPTKLLHEVGNVRLEDRLLGQSFVYDVDSFFQVNIPVFEQALTRIRQHCNEPNVTDMYAGVGSIGLSVAKQSVELVELDAASAGMARINLKRSAIPGVVTEADTANAIQSIVSDKAVIFDPPRAGLHRKVVDRVLEVKPLTVIYLSCNPATQARDLALLGQAYDIDNFEVFNFFPRTPHIETLAVLKKRGSG